MWHVTHEMWHMTCDTWHVTHDVWHMICDKWHITCDIWHVTHGGRWTFTKHFRSLANTDREWRCLENLEEKDQSMNQLINYKGVCRTAPATPGLLIMNHKECSFYMFWLGHQLLTDLVKPGLICNRFVSNQWSCLWSSSSFFENNC